MIKNYWWRIIYPLAIALKHKSLLRGFISREVKGRFAGNMAGMAWALINPFTTLVVYLFVFSIVLRINVTVEETGTDSFFIYFVTGFIPWLIFSDSLSRATGSILENASIVTKVIFPVELLPMTSVLSGLLVNSAGLILLMGYLTWMGFINVTWLLLFVVVPVQVIFTLGLGMLLSSICVYLRDIREMIGLLLMAWFFATPIIYPLSMVPDHIQTVIELNPMYIFVAMYRDILILNNLEMKLMLASVLAALVSYVAGSLFFARVKPGFGDVL